MSAARRSSPSADSRPDVLAWAAFDTDVIVLLVTGAIGTAAFETAAEEPVDLPTSTIPLDMADGPGHQLAVVRTTGPNHDLRHGLVLVDLDRRATIDREQLEHRRLDPVDLVVEHLAPLDEPQRIAVTDLLVESIMVGAGPGVSISQLLHQTRELLRPRHQLGVVEGDGRRGGVIESILHVDDHTVYVRGWLGWRPEQIRGVTLISPEGERVTLDDDVFRYHRNDVNDFYGMPAGTSPLGFATHVTTVGESRLAGGWLLDICTSDGGRFEIEAPAATLAPTEVRDSLVAEMKLDEHDALTSGHLQPCLARWANRVKRATRIQSIEEYGSPPSAPMSTVLVPLYGRLDYVEYQLAQFSLDPDFRTVDLLYILDSPELANELAAWAPRLHRRYETAFRIAYLSENGGFAIANNLGASVASARHLVLLNSDVIPEAPGWVTALRVALDPAGPDRAIGAVGPMLLYEDDSLQHCGMYFSQASPSEPWCNEHYFKGLHRSFAAANVSREVPALTAACLSIARDTYLSVGGLDSHYVQGDYEDSDLCLKLRGLGLACWFDADIVLRHLEGGSYPSARRVHLGQFNQWLHHRRWDTEITEIMSDPANQVGWAVEHLTDGP